MRIFGEDRACRLVHADVDVSRALGAVAKYRPDILLMDCENSDQELKAISRVVVSTGIKIVVFPTMTKVEHAIRAIEAGASGYLSSDCTGDEVKYAIGRIASGDTFISPNIAGKVVVAMRQAEIRKAAERRAQLNSRERQVADLLLKGGTNKEIARKLGLTENTVKHYMTALLQKHSARNRLQLANALRQTDMAAGADEAWKN